MNLDHAGRGMVQYMAARETVPFFLILECRLFCVFAMMQRQVSFACGVVDAGIIDHDRKVGIFRFSGLRAICKMYSWLRWQIPAIVFNTIYIMLNRIYGIGLPVMHVHGKSENPTDDYPPTYYSCGYRLLPL